MTDDPIEQDTPEPDNVAGFLIALRALGDAPAPPPTQAVAALIGGGVPVRLHPYRRAAVRAGLVAAAMIAALVGAAANHGLPQPAQRVVSNVVNHLTPFDIGPGKSAAPPTAPTHTHKPEPERSGTGDEPTHSAEPSDRGGGESQDNSTPERTQESDGSTEPSSTHEAAHGEHEPREP